jgi:hypothetical protein
MVDIIITDSSANIFIMGLIQLFYKFFIISILILYYNKMVNKTKKTNILKQNSKKNITNIIRQKLDINIYKKKFNGEVFTPMNIVEEMLDTLPLSVWGNPNLKWLDPANGIGNFPICCYFRLMEGLNNKISDSKKRSKHIIEKMLFMVETNSKNNLECRNIFTKIDPQAKPNIITIDFLKYKTGFNFDIVMGNPPYNLDGSKSNGTKNYYVYFSIKALELLKNGGFLLMIHPPGYRIPKKIKATQTDLNSIYLYNKIHFIKMYDVPTILKLMKVMINLDYFLLQKTKTGKTFQTQIIGTNGKEYRAHLEVGDMVPNFGYSILEKLKRASIKNGNMDIISNSEHHHTRIKDNTDKSKKRYKNVHLIKKKGVKIYHSYKKHKLHDKSKFLINALGKPYVFDDTKGEYGFTQSQVCLKDLREVDKVLIKSSLLQYVQYATRITGNNLNTRMESYLPRMDGSNKNLENIMNTLNLSKSEKDEINEYKVPSFILKEMNEN